MKPTTRARKCLVMRSYAMRQKRVLFEESNTYIVGFPPVQEVPKVEYYSNTDGHDGENSIDLGRPSTSHEEASSKHPSPPIECELAAMSPKCPIAEDIACTLTGNDICGT